MAACDYCGLEMTGADGCIEAPIEEHLSEEWLDEMEERFELAEPEAF